MRDTTDHNEKVKSVYEAMNAAPTMSTEVQKSEPVADNASFGSETNHTTISSLNAQDPSSKQAKPL